MRNVSRRTVAVLLLLFAITLSLFVTVSLAGEQEPQVAATQMAQLKIRGVKTAPIRANDELLKQLTGKRQFNSEVVRKAISYRGEIPILKLKSGKRVALESIRVEAMPTPQEREESLTISPKVLRYLPYIKASWIGRILIPLGPPDNVDHMACQTPIREQGDRGTCTAFASMAGYEAFASCTNHTTLDLSEQHAYHIFMQQVGSTCKADAGIQTWQGAGFLTSNHVCNESAMPYTTTIGSLPTNDATHVPSGCSGSAPYGFVTTQTIFGTAFGGDVTVNANNTNYLESILSSGYDIVYGLYCAGSDWGDGTAETGVIDVQMSGGSPAPAFAGHAMLLVGYNRPSQYFIFKNSWGTGQGHAGYLHISYNYLQTYGKYGYYITAITP
jgi:hypothetical protein